MKGKSLRWIAILAMVVCAQLAVASQASANVFNVPPTFGDTGSVRSWQPLNNVGYDPYTYVGSRPAAWLSAGHAGVQQITWRSAMSQTVFAKVYIERWANGWYLQASFDLQPITIAPYDTSYKYFSPHTFYLASGYYYRARIYIQWCQTNGGSRLGSKIVASDASEYVETFAYSLHPVPGFNDASGEGYVYYPVISRY